MATTQQGSTLQELAQRHLWMHFSRMGAYGAGHESRSSSAATAATSGTTTATATSTASARCSA